MEYDMAPEPWDMYLGGGFSNMFGMFNRILGEDESNLTNTSSYQMGWNHQLVFVQVGRKLVYKNIWISGASYLYTIWHPCLRNVFHICFAFNNGIEMV